MADLPPSRDPNVPHPGMMYYGGKWRSPAGVEALRKGGRKRDEERNPRRIRIRAGGIQFNLGYAPTIEQAQALREKIKKEAPGGSVQKS